MVKVKWLFALLIIICGFQSSVQAQVQNYITPEQYGAKGDGNSDDSPAFSKCLQKGKLVRLSKGKTYVLHTRIAEISYDSLIIDGNNAKLVIAANYPTNQYENIFKFGASVSKPKLLQVTDLSITCLLGRKFVDKQKRGDTYVFTTSKCNYVRMKNVNFACTTEYNNVSFLVSNGGNISMDKCQIVLNTRSVQGGIFWMMNKYKDKVNISLTNCCFEHDTQDETMCFSAFGTVDYPKFSMNVNVDNCTFYSNGNTNSSGFIIAYNHADGVFMDANIQYADCMFSTDGLHKRRIQSYQCGGKGGDYGSFKTKFKKCQFDFNLKRRDETGILSLLPASNTIPKDSIYYDFEKCKFNISNISTLIGDKDGDKKGVYKFMKCVFISDASLFNKQYNKGNGRIDVVLKNCKGSLNDETLSSENLYMSNSKFENVKGLHLYPKSLIYTKNTVLNVAKTWIGGIKYPQTIHPVNLKVVVTPQRGYKQISLSAGDVVYGDVNDGRDFGIYFYSDKKPSKVVCVINGREFPMSYIEKEQCYFNNIRFQQNMYRKGINTIKIETNSQSLAIMSFTISVSSQKLAIN